MIILAAGSGTRLRPFTDTRPKCMVEVGGRPLVQWALDAARANGIDTVTIVGGYQSGQLSDLDAELVVNEEFESTNMVHSLFLAERDFDDGFIMSYGDIVYGPGVLRQVLESDAEIGVVVDRDWRPYWEERFGDPLADAETLTVSSSGHITDLGRKPDGYHQIQGQYIGLAVFRSSGVEALRETYARLTEGSEPEADPDAGAADARTMYMTDLLRAMIHAGHELISIPIGRGWAEVDTCHDLTLANRLADEGRLGSF